MDPARPPTSDLHGALVGVLLAGAAAWLALNAVLFDWAWDGQTVLGVSGRWGAVLAAASAAGLAASAVAAMLGAIKRRRIRLSVLASLGAGQAAALVLAGALGAALAMGLGISDVLVPVGVGGALLLSAAATGAVMLVPRREA